MRDRILPDPEFHGTFLTEDQLAEMVGGVSRTPVREALLLLAAEGLVDLVPRHGAYIPPVTEREIAEALDFRSLIEVRAARLVLESGRAPVDEMQRVLGRQRELSAPGNEREFSELDSEFHVVLVNAAGNSLMTKAYVDLRARHVRIGVRALMNTPERQASVIAEHAAIVEALRLGERDVVEGAILGHIDTTRKGLGAHAHASSAASWTKTRSAV